MCVGDVLVYSFFERSPCAGGRRAGELVGEGGVELGEGGVELGEGGVAFNWLITRLCRFRGSSRGCSGGVGVRTMDSFV